MNNEAHFHLMINHFPIILPIVGLIIIILGIVFKNDLVKRIAFGVLITGALTAFMAMNSGEGAEEIVEELGRNHKLIHEHEEQAESFALLSYILGLISVIALWLNWKKHPFKDLSMYITMLLTTIVLYFGKSAGTSGGEITHEEIRSEISEEKGE
jgi:uncharacterized membrane protein